MKWTLSPSFGDTFGIFWPLLLTTSVCVKSSCLLPWKKTGAIVNDYMPLPKWILSQSFGDTFSNFRPLSLTTLTCVNHIYYWLLRTRAIANLEAIMLMNTLVILRVTFGNFRTLSLTTSACVNLQIDLLLDLLITSDACYRNLLNTTMLMNSLAILLCTLHNVFWPLRLLSIFI